MNQQPALLVDARNAIYRAVYAGRSDTRPGPKYHYFVIFLRQIVHWMNSVRPSSVHIFWDAPRNTVWRRQILPTYKDRSTSDYVEGLAEDLAKTTAVAQSMFSVMGVRQYERKEMEADDLIYTFVSVAHPMKTVIVSSDSDMMQIPFRFSSSSVFDPKEMSEVPIPLINPVYMKSLVGDKSDHIDGYYGIGPKKGQALLESHSDLQDYLNLKGAEIFRRNLTLIDLSMCPFLLKNTIYVQKKMAEPVKFVREEIQSLIMKHKVNGLQQEFNDLVVPFKNMA